MKLLDENEIELGMTLLRRDGFLDALVNDVKRRPDRLGSLIAYAMLIESLAFTYEHALALLDAKKILALAGDDEPSDWDDFDSERWTLPEVERHALHA